MVRLLEIDISPFREIDIRRFDQIALVDTQPGTGHNPLPASRTPTIVIDHHPGPHRTRDEIPFCLVSRAYGATSSILASILRLAQVSIDPRLATALSYGIKSDTKELLHAHSAEDQENYLFLLQLADKRILAEIENAQVSREYYEDILRSLGKAVVRGKVIFSDIGRVDRPDMVAEMADFFSRLEGIRWSICLGLYRRSLIVSIRSLDRRRQANWVVSRLVAGLGTGGGHGQMAAGRIPLSEERPADKMRAEVKNRAIDLLKVRRRREVKLVRESSQSSGDE
jgi:nanoRNase/pAp phosphatase (c-di-AMP/oligoRNAs hydrolase)